MTAEPRMAGRRALITGAANGIGRATAHRLAAEGATIAALDLRADSLESLAAEIELAEANQTYVGCKADVSDADQVEAAVATAAETLGGLDTVVICAGIAIPGELHKLPLEHWRRVIDTNLSGAFYTLRYAIPHLLANGSGAVVTVGSVASLVAAGNAPSYDSSKGGILQLTRTVAANYAQQHIRANCICPGLIDTDSKVNTAHIIGAPGPMANPRPHRINTPLGRKGTAGEVAALIAYLCSDESQFITGTAIPIDGGWTVI
jgi:NAD(P)-dependent dehydrogenase (short-subunit alcohol dehydrogenase family)